MATEVYTRNVCAARKERVVREDGELNVYEACTRFVERHFIDGVHYYSWKYSRLSICPFFVNYLRISIMLV